MSADPRVEAVARMRELCAMLVDVALVRVEAVRANPVNDDARRRETSIVAERITLAKQIRAIPVEAALAAADAVAGDGWVLVPREPTAEMVRAGGEGLFDCYRGYNEETQQMMMERERRTNERKASRAYRAMIAPAPQKEPS